MNTIDRLSAHNISRTYVHNADSTQTSASAKAERENNSQQPQADSVSLSDSARSLAAARDAVQNAPDVREQKVADIKQRVQDGTYSVPSRVLARNLLDQQTQQ